MLCLKKCMNFCVLACLIKSCESGDAHSFERAVAGQAICMQRLGTVLSWGDELIEQVTDIRIMTTSYFIQTWYFHPHTSYFSVQRHVQLKQITE